LKHPIRVRVRVRVRFRVRVRVRSMAASAFEARLRSPEAAPQRAEAMAEAYNYIRVKT